MSRARWIAVMSAVVAAAGLLAAFMLGSSAGKRLEATGPGQQAVNEAALAVFRANMLECLELGSPQEPAPASRCLDEAILKHAPVMGVVTVLAGLREAVTEHGDVFAELCHRNAHYLGEYAGRTFPNMDVALGVGGPDCEFGYFHGVVEGYAATTPTLWEELPLMCSKLSGDKMSYVYQECSHSLGHAIVTRTDNDVAEGVEKCRLLPTDPERSACATGIFMSWSNTLDKRIAAGKPLDGKWAWAPKDQRWLHCPDFDDVMAGGCVLYFSETAPHTAEGLQSFRQWCTAALEGRKLPVEQCHRGVGRVSGAEKEFLELGRWKGIVALCTEGYEYAAASECAKEAYTIAAGFQRDPGMVTEACEAWTGHPKQKEQCAFAKEMFDVVTADTGLRMPTASARPEEEA